MTARRWPIVTTIVLLVCVAVQVRLSTMGGEEAAEVLRTYGYVPAHPAALALLTSPFLHAGWMHLAGNLWFLVFCGMTLEDRWGRGVFAAFYLASGGAAALLHGALSAGDAVPLVGASGAIAGCMGAFAVALPRTRGRFRWLLSLRPRTFTARAFLVLPFWALFEAVWAFAFPTDGTAHWAHVGGFAFGALVSLVLRRTGLDRKLDDAVEQTAVLGGDPRIEEARRLVGGGRAPEALAMLEGLALEKPGSALVHEAIAEAAHALGDEARENKARERARRLRAVA